VKLKLEMLNISNIKRISFRQDINGLRAIAVLAVVFYHADIEIFKGGWLGVDIFFVISGYLISNIIISELNEGTFTFKNFYLRRVRRILPALFSTLLLTIPISYYLLTPKAMDEYLNSMVASVFFYANYHFMNLDFYVAESTKFMPLLHTWSLAIEEQYYLLFPLFAYFVYKYFKKHFAYFFVFIALGSIYVNTLSSSTDKFYRLEFRIWELLLGVLVMILDNNLKIKHLEKIGLPLMLFPIFYFDDAWINDLEPKLLSLFGIALIIFSNHKKSKLSKFLSLKLISILGLSSYSIYLLHQPVFSFYRRYLDYYDFTFTNSKKLYLMTGLLILSYINYVIIEKPSLNNNKIKIVLNKLAVAFVLIIGFIIISKSTDIVKSRFIDIPEFSTGWINSNFAPQGELIGSDESPKFIIIGDSHTLHLMSYLAKSADEQNFSFIQISHSACFSFINYTNYYNPEDLNPPPDRESCYEVVNVLIKYLNKNDIPVIFANTWMKTFAEQETNIPLFYFKEDKENWSELIDILINEISLIKKVTKSNSDWFIIGKNPGSYNYKDDGYINCLSKSQIKKNNYCELEGNIEEGTFYLGNKLFASKLAEIDEVKFINPYDLYCDGTKCFNYINSNLIYIDHHHFTYEGSKLLVDEILKTVLK